MRRGLAGLERVPVRVLSRNETESLEIALIENLQRQDLNSIEEARGYRKLLTEYRMTQAELADKVSKSRSAITNALRLLDLPDEVQDLVYENKMTAGHARAVLSVSDEPIRLKLAQKIVDDGLSVREAENLARLYAAGQTERAPRPTTPKSFKTVARKLRRLLTTNVRVKLAKDKGKIEIEFQGEEDLERIFALLTHEEGAGNRGGECRMRRNLEYLAIGIIVGAVGGFLAGLLLGARRAGRRRGSASPTRRFEPPMSPGRSPSRPRMPLRCSAGASSTTWAVTKRSRGARCARSERAFSATRKPRRDVRPIWHHGST